MARSERYIPPSEERIKQWEREAEEKRQFDADRRELIEKALAKLTKAQLAEVLMSLDTFDPSVRWSIESKIGLQKPVDLIAYDLRHAIGIATQVDDADLNQNFSYNWQAYEEVERGFRLLIGQDAIDIAMEIAIEFMKLASYQVECSDEGLMSEQIEQCLRHVIEAVAQVGTSSRSRWSAEMMFADRCGVICVKELEQLSANASPPNDKGSDTPSQQP